MKKLKVGVIGVSGHLQTRMLLPMTSSDVIEVVALASRSIEKALSVAKEWGIEKAYGTYEELLEDKSIEAVYIPLPNHLHLEWIKKAVMANKHVLCEKPLALSKSEVKEIIELSNSHNVKIMEAFMYRFHPKWKTVKELMKVSGIGEVQSIHTIFTYTNHDPNNIRNIKEYGGGALMDIGCYAISSARFIMGKEPQRVMGLIDYSKTSKTDILSSAIMDFGKARALFTVSTGLYPAQEVKVYGTGGSLEIMIPFNDFYDMKGQIKVITNLGERVLEFEPTNQYGELFKAFTEAINKDTALPVSLLDSYMNMEIMEKIIKSGESNNWELISDSL
jgi:predicted dehydrogenase